MWNLEDSPHSLLILIFNKATLNLKIKYNSILGGGLFTWSWKRPHVWMSGIFNIIIFNIKEVWQAFWFSYFNAPSSQDMDKLHLNRIKLLLRLLIRCVGISEVETPNHLDYMTQTDFSQQDQQKCSRPIDKQCVCLCVCQCVCVTVCVSVCSSCTRLGSVFREQLKVKLMCCYLQ